MSHIFIIKLFICVCSVPLDIDKLGEEQKRKMTLQINKNSPMFFV